jgi:hypothetical protein
MTLGIAQRVYAVEAAKQHPKDPAAAQQYLLQKCQENNLAAPKNPGEFISTWADRLTPKGDLRSNAHRSGRKPKLTNAQVQRAYKAILAYEKAGRSRPYESQIQIAAECPYVKQLLTKTGSCMSTLLARIRQKHPRFGRYLLRTRWHMTDECQQQRLATAQNLLDNYGDKLDYVVHLDAKTVYLQEKKIYGYVDLAVGYTVSRIPAATKNSRVIKLRYYAAVNAKLGAFFIIYYTGTTDMPAKRPGAHYKVSSGVEQLWLLPGSNILQCLPELCSPLPAGVPEVRVTLLHPQPQHTPTPLDCCIGIRTVSALPCADTVTCIVGLGDQPTAVPFPHHFDQQAVRCEHSKVPPLSARAYGNALAHLYLLLLAEAAGFCSIHLNQLLPICQIIQHLLWPAAFAAAHVAGQVTILSVVNTD